MVGFVILVQSLEGIAQNNIKPDATDVVGGFGYPPSWNPIHINNVINPHYVIVTVAANPRINSIPLVEGDYIGAFYIDDYGQMKCGGADYWKADSSIVFTLFADDGETPEKDGFSYAELINYKVFSWTTQKTYDVDIFSYDPEYPFANWYPLTLSMINNMQCLEVFDAYATANPNPVCLNNQVTLAANIFIGTTGNYTFNWTSNPTGFTSNLQYPPAVTPLVNTNYLLSVSDGSHTSTHQVSVVVNQNPQVNAGSDITICANQTAQIAGSATNYGSHLWTTSGNGTFSNAGLFDPIYTPGSLDKQNGSVVLTLTVQPLQGCTATASDQLTITVLSLPTVNAGPDKSGCKGSPVPLNATAANFSTVQWTTAGDGTFSNAQTLNPQYYPGSADITTGNFTLTVLVNAITQCTGTASDQIKITLINPPTAGGPPSRQLCETTPTVTINGSATNYSAVHWTTAGDGTFANPDVLVAVYAPGPNDKLAGETTVTLNALPNDPCTVTAIKNVSIIIKRNPVIDAGNTNSVCLGQSLQLNASASYYNTIQWTSSGNGGFNNPYSLTAIYTPGPSDIAAGQFTLTLTGTALYPCTLSASDNLLVQIIGSPTAQINTPSNQTLCAPPPLQLSASATNYDHLLWTTSGNGTFSNPAILNPIYTPGTADISGSPVTLTLTAFAAAGCGSNAIKQILVTFIAGPSVNAGNDATVCQGSTHTLAGTATNQSSVLWTTSGNGTFSSTSSLTPVYTPGTTDINAGTVTLTLTASAVSPCTASISDAKTLVIQKTPTANAGSDATVCQGSTHTLAGTATNQASVLWTTSGSGTFSSTNSLNPIYTPGAADIAAGSVTLTLTASAVSPCTASISDAKTLVIQKTPTANAGSDATVCQGSTHTLAGTATNQASVLWTTSGSGTFSSTNSLNPIYTPGAADIAAGSVTLTLTASAVSPCTASISDAKTLVIQKTPTANAGSDATVCQGSTHTLAGTATNQSSVSWTTSGNGTFSSTSSLTPVYAPGTTDITAGTVTLTLTASAVSPCTTSVSDAKILVIQKTPAANAGSDATVCQGSTHTLAGTATNQASVLWTTSGNGTFSSTSSLTPVYTPGTTDISAGTVTLTLTASAVSPCTVAAVDSKILIIQKTPAANAGSDATVCQGNTHTLAGTATNQSSVLWTTSGNGTFSSTSSLTPVYTPGTTDITAGTVSLTLTASAVSPCTTSISDAKTLVIQKTPTANAGSDATVCQGSTHTLAGTATNQSSVLWTTSGNGTFSSTNSLNPIYTPGAADIAAGTATLTLTASAISPCTTSVSDAKILVIRKTPAAYAGIDATILEGASFPVSATASNYSSILWQTNGDGTFSNPVLLNPVYYPGITDIETSSVELTISVSSVSPCVGSVNDFLTLTIMRQQLIQIPVGWSGLSSFVLPLNPAFEQVMAPIANNLIVAKNMLQVYWPEFGINTIGNFDPAEGYLVKMNAATTLPISGFAFQNKTIHFTAGWNILPVLSPVNVGYQQLISQLGNKLIIVTEIAGTGIIWPDEGIYTIPFLVPGKAYWIKVRNQCNFTFPD